MGKNTSITLGKHFESFVEKEVKSGKYSSVSEVIRSALRLLESEKTKERELLNALRAGEQSKMISDFDPEDHLKRIHKRYL